MSFAIGFGFKRNSQSIATKGLSIFLPSSAIAMSTTTVRTRTRTSSTEAVAGSQTGGNGRGGRGRGRGRGGDRGRGRGRGRGEEPHFPGPAHHLTPNPEVQPPSHTGTATTRQPKPRLTHFLALPIGHHADLRRRISAFTDALLRTDPAIPGLDETIVINPRRLHLTLGVMSLDLDGTASHGTRSKTLDTAAQLLNELKPQVMKMLAGEKLRIGLKRIDIMKPERGDLEKAHILWTGPTQEGEDAKRLRDVSNFVHKEFQRAGLVVDENRPLKLHCTVLNTTYRQPRGRKPFSYAAMINSAALQAIEKAPEGDKSVMNGERGTPSAGHGRNRGRTPLHVDFGDWEVEEVQICEMGSWGREGEYVCARRITLD